MQDLMCEYTNIGYIEPFEREGIEQRAKSIRHLCCLALTDNCVFPTTMCFSDAMQLLNLKEKKGKKGKKGKGLHDTWKRNIGKWIYKDHDLLWPTKRHQHATISYRFCVSENLDGNALVESQYKGENGVWMRDCIWNFNGENDSGSLKSVYSCRSNCVLHWAKVLKNVKELPSDLHKEHNTYTVEFRFKGTVGNEELSSVSLVFFPEGYVNGASERPREAVGCTFRPGLGSCSLNMVESIFSHLYYKGDSLCFTLGKEGKVVTKEEEGIERVGPMCVWLDEDNGHRLSKQKGVVFDDRLGGVKVSMMRKYVPVEDSADKVLLAKETIMVLPRDRQDADNLKAFDALPPEYARGEMVIRIFGEDGALKNCKFEDPQNPTVLFEGPRLHEYRSGLLFASGLRACAIDPDKEGAVCAVLIRNKVHNQTHQFTEMNTNEVRLILHMDGDNQRHGFHKIVGVSYTIFPTTWEKLTEHNAVIHGFLNIQGDSESGHVFGRSFYYVDCVNSDVKQCDGVKEIESYTNSDTLRLPNQEKLWRENHDQRFEDSVESGVVAFDWTKSRTLRSGEILGIKNKQHRSAILVVAEILEQDYTSLMIRQTPLQERKKSYKEDPLMSLRGDIENCVVDVEEVLCSELEGMCSEEMNKMKRRLQVEADVKIARAEQRFRDDLKKAKQHFLDVVDQRTQKVERDLQENLEKCKRTEEENVRKSKRREEEMLRIIRKKEAMCESLNRALDLKTEAFEKLEEAYADQVDVVTNLKDEQDEHKRLHEICLDRLSAENKALKQTNEALISENKEHKYQFEYQVTRNRCLQLNCDRMHGNNLVGCKDDELRKLQVNLWAAMERVQTQQQENLRREKEKLTCQAGKDTDEGKCVICTVHSANVFFPQCGHMCVCLECCPRIGIQFTEHDKSECAEKAACPMCRMSVTDARRVYTS